ncbi:MAG: uroporphyrinogen decarboxylase [Eubacterium sp.]|nr:uroporphyrinogen decarboxylase [Eubacterium sp.]
MLTAKENMREVIKGGNPDRYVNQYEALSFCMHPFMFFNPSVKKGGPDIVDAWGVTRSWPAGVPGGFPVHTPDKVVIKDIEDWKEYVHAPNLKFDSKAWEMAEGMAAGIDREKSFATAMVAPGLFENTHHLSGMDNALLYYMINEDEMKDLIKYLTDWELEMAEGICSHLHPDALLHHDDWGSEQNSFLRPEMFEDYFLDAYKQIYGYYHDHGVEFIIHHSDSYCANIVPIMIEMGIDVWQGCMHSNNNPELIKKYGGKMTFMGEIDNKFVDFPGWTPADCEKAARDAIASCGQENKYFIPCITQGGPGSTFPGTYKELTEAIYKINEEKFGWTREQQVEAAPPMIVMFE